MTDRKLKKIMAQIRALTEESDMEAAIYRIYVISVAANHDVVTARKIAADKKKAAEIARITQPERPKL